PCGLGARGCARVGKEGRSSWFCRSYNITTKWYKRLFCLKILRLSAPLWVDLEKSDPILVCSDTKTVGGRPAGPCDPQEMSKYPMINLLQQIQARVSARYAWPALILGTAGLTLSGCPGGAALENAEEHLE